MTAVRLPVTVVVPVKNEEQNLHRCLAALSRFEKTVVVDSDSTDRTSKIAIEAGATVLKFSWDGHYPKKRNWALLNHAPSTPWVLFLDADEFVDAKFCDEVARATASSECNGFWLNYTNYFLGRRLRFGVPQRKLALFRVGKGLYERIEEDRWSKLDMEIHEHPLVEGRVGEIKTPIEHNDFRGIGKFLDRHREYAEWEAHRVLLFKRERESSNQSFTKRQRFKYANILRWWYPWIYFFYTYVARFGVLDGSAGFQYAFYKAWYFLTIQNIAAELEAREHTTS